MVLLLALAVFLWGLGHLLGVTARLRWAALAVLYLAAIGAAVLLPEGNALRESLGGSPAPLLMLGAVGALIWLYRRALLALRRRAPTPTDVPPTPQDALSATEISRHARHIMLRDIGGPGQQRLKAASVLVIGAGGLGLPAAMALGAAGVGRIGLIDPDRVEPSNLPRQSYYNDADLGRLKVQAATERLAAQNPNLEIRPYSRAFVPEIAEALIGEYDLILEGTDSFAAKRLATETAARLGRPLLIAALSPWEAQMMLSDPMRGGPCHACVFPTAPSPETAPSCAEAGVVAPLPGIVGAAMALEAIKYLTDAGESLRGALWCFDGRSLTAERFRLTSRPDCSICANLQREEAMVAR